MPSDLRARPNKSNSSSSSSSSGGNHSPNSPRPTTNNNALINDRRPRTKLLSWSELAHHAKDNSYIQSGYRHPSTSARTSLSSLLYLHNESVNILTHALGALYFAVCGGVYLVSWWRRRGWIPAATAATAATSAETSSSTTTTGASLNLLDAASLACFFTAAVVCLGLSATYHLLSDRADRNLVLLWNRLDYAGIVVLIWGSFVPAVRFGFREYPPWMLVYVVMITAMAAVCLVVTLKRRFVTPEYRTTRTAAFVLMGSSGVLPVLHGVCIYGVEDLRSRIGLDYLLVEGGLYVLGAALYASRIPEKYRPGRHDLIGSSHQIFHVLVVMAAYSHMLGLNQAWNFEHGSARD